MPIATTCPNCKAMFRLSDELSGKMVKCQKCQQLFVVPEGNAETVAPGASVASELDPAPVESAPAAAPLPLPPPPTPPPVLLAAVDENAIEERDRDEPPPLPHKRRAPVPERRRDEPAKSGSGAMAIVLAVLGLSVLLCVVCAGAGVGFYVLTPMKQPARPIVIRDKVKPADFAKMDDRKDIGKIDRPMKDGPKADGVKDGFVPPALVPPNLAAGIPAAIGADGQFQSASALNGKDPLWRDKHFKVYSIRLEANKNYQIDMVSGEFDSYLFLFDDANKYITHDDDGGGFPNARIIFTPTRTATYHIVATTFNAQQPGNFTLTVRRN